MWRVLLVGLLPAVVTWPYMQPTPTSTLTPISLSSFENCIEVDLFHVEELRNVLRNNFMVDNINKKSEISFGLLDEDWQRLHLLESRIPNNSLLKTKLVRTFRLLIAALYQAHLLSKDNSHNEDHSQNNSNKSNRRNNKPPLRGDHFEDYIVDDSYEAAGSDPNEAVLLLPAKMPTSDKKDGYFVESENKNSSYIDNNKSPFILDDKNEFSTGKMEKFFTDSNYFTTASIGDEDLLPDSTAYSESDLYEEGTTQSIHSQNTEKQNELFESSSTDGSSLDHRYSINNVSYQDVLVTQVTSQEIINDKYSSSPPPIIDSSLDFSLPSESSTQLEPIFKDISKEAATNTHGNDAPEPLEPLEPDERMFDTKINSEENTSTTIITKDTTLSTSSSSSHFWTTLEVSGSKNDETSPDQWKHPTTEILTSTSRVTPASGTFTESEIYNTKSDTSFSEYTESITESSEIPQNKYNLNSNEMQEGKEISDNDLDTVKPENDFGTDTSIKEITTTLISELSDPTIKHDTTPEIQEGKEISDNDLDTDKPDNDFGPDTSIKEITTTLTSESSDPTIKHNTTPQIQEDKDISDNDLDTDKPDNDFGTDTSIKEITTTLTSESSDPTIKHDTTPLTTGSISFPRTSPETTEPSIVVDNRIELPGSSTLEDNEILPKELSDEDFPTQHPTVSLTTFLTPATPTDTFRTFEVQFPKGKENSIPIIPTGNLKLYPLNYYPHMILPPIYGNKCRDNNNCVRVQNIKYSNLLGIQTLNKIKN